MSRENHLVTTYTNASFEIVISWTISFAEQQWLQIRNSLFYQPCVKFISGDFFITVRAHNIEIILHTKYPRTELPSRRLL